MAAQMAFGVAKWGLARPETAVSMSWRAKGVWLQSHWVGMPQAGCLSAESTLCPDLEWAGYWYFAAALVLRAALAVAAVEAVVVEYWARRCRS